MSEADRVTTTIGVTRNLGDYNSVRIDCQYETAVRSGEDESDAVARSWAFVEKQVEEKLEEYEVED